MPLYAYRAMDLAGRIVPGAMDASNSADLELRLRRMELDLIDFHLSGQKDVAFGARRVRRADLINFCFHMEQLTGAGVPILEGLADLRDSLDHPRMREIVTDLIESIEGGQPLSVALGHHDEVFDNTFVSLVRAGESSGHLTDVFRNLTESLRWQDEQAAQMKKIISYPLLVMVVVLGVMFFLMIVLVPQLTTFIRNMGGELPLHTRALIFVSGIFIHFWYLIIGLPLIGWFATRAWLRRNDEARLYADALKLRAPLVGEVLHKMILARFATFFGLMYGSGITILECIRLSEGIVGNRMVAAALRRAGQLISEGQGVAAAFQATGIFPPLVLRMLRVGETTGDLEGAMRNVSYFYNREVRELIERVQSLIEPTMTVVLGLLLGWIMLSVLGPIYDTLSTLRT
ncbi:type II secretion system F family protein [Massilia arenosa]|uniref:General secretion pathway protein F n=1 Tax=Zemynaea arenosa TaxID=2561931 RepID=A0A4Y9S0C7_9BURK|nr:type II secretion system F family protein [Massilia arenosa]TFW14830.1 type II secretion system F family protein [Massilia arenosa]